MSDALWAARLDDPLLHTSVWADILSGAMEFVAGAVVGALVVGALAVVGIATCGVGAFVLGALIGGVVGYFWGDKITAVCDDFANSLFPPTEQAWIKTGSINTKTNSKLAARAAGIVDYSVSLEEIKKQLEQQPKEEVSFLDQVGSFFSQMWRPTVATPDPRASPSPNDEDKILCLKPTANT